MTMNWLGSTQRSCHRVTLVMWSVQKNRARESRDGVLTPQILNMVLVIFFFKLFNLQNKHSEDNDPIMLTLGKTNKPLFHIDHILGNAHRLD